MLNLHLNLIFVSFSLYFMLRQTSAMVFEETPIEELDQLIEKQIAEERADDAEFQFSRYRRNAKMRLCGRKLIETLHHVCNGCTRPLPSKSEDLSLDLRRKRDAHEHHHEHSQRTKRAGLAEQCCMKSCTLDTLKKHCSPC